MKYYSIGEFAAAIGVTQQTLRNWHKQGTLVPARIAESGYRYYSEDQLREMLGTKPKKNRITIGYCRVSSPKQKDDLERQVESMRQYLIAQGKPFDLIQDVGSGINYTKKGLQQLIQRVTLGEVDKIVVMDKDRLLRFGFEIIEYLASLYGCEIEVIDHTEKTEEQELVEDLVQIITVFSCKLQGRRANKARKMIKELMENDSSKKNQTQTHG
jgi:predicted site-specific integrase-resolvase